MNRHPSTPRRGRPHWPRLRRGSAIVAALIAALAAAAPAPARAAPAERPSIVFILADDLGYGDVRCYNPDGKIPTPHIDALAAQGMRFTDAHTSSSVCTPTRYGLLTGRYNWRSRLQSGVLGGYSRRLIEPDRLTVPAFLARHGYWSACIGKWHLGMDWPLAGGGVASDYADGWKVDYAAPIANSPTSLGFDAFFGISASLDMPPYAFIEGDRATAVPTVEKKWIRQGPAAADFEAIDVLPRIAERAERIIAERADAAKRGEPFFLYVPLTAPHTPIVPAAAWQGKSGLGEYGDFTMQVDDAVGRMLAALDKAGIAESALVIFTSDNGCSPAAGIDAMAEKGHRVGGPLRGHKADIFEGGHRVPFIARWPGKVAAGSASDRLVCLNDLLATCADLAGAALPDDAGEDSVSLLPALLGKPDPGPARALVHHSINGSFAIRQGRWKLILCPDSGGWSAPRPGSEAAAGLPAAQLYDLAADIGETRNVIAERPRIAARLRAALEKQIAEGRSTPGAPQQNAVEISIEKGARPRAAAASAATAAAPAEPQAPNIVFIFSDDHAYQAIGAYGSRINTTPNIDRLAREGMRFDRCVVPNSICGPSRASILTGKYSHANGFYDNSRSRFDGSQTTFPKLLRAAGYQTALVGKWHLVTDPTGFDYWHILPGQGIYYNPPMIDNGKRVKHEGYTTSIITDLAISWLREKRDPTKPFLLMAQHKAPHREWAPALKHLSLYSDRDIPEPETLFDDYAGRGKAEHAQDMTIERTLTRRDLKLDPPPGINPAQLEAWNAVYGPENEALEKAGLEGKDLVRWKYQRYIKDYLRCIASVDESVGRLLDYLDETGLAKSTIVVYASDQGFYLGEHGWFDKRWIFEESLRTPFLVRWPGVVAPGSVNADIVSNIDFAPTFIAAAGVEVPADVHGRSLLPILRGRTPADWRKSFYYHYYEFPGPHSVRRHYGVVTDRYKLVRFYGNDIDEWELFDLETDPREMKSVLGAEGYAGIEAELREELARLRRELAVPEKDPAITYPRPRPAPAEKRAAPRRKEAETKKAGDGAAEKSASAGEPAAAAAPRPHIVVILADDMGYSDPGCFGGEIRTPNIDRLAAGGLRFTHFYNTSRCCPTRASLLTGLWSHQAGLGRMTFDDGLPGYRGELAPDTVTIAEALRASGYRTAMAGKWHVSRTREGPGHMANLNNQKILDRFADPASYPTSRGFDSFYGNLWGVVDFFDPFSLVHGVEAVRRVPADYYITDAITEHAVAAIDAQVDGDAPLFLYVAYTAPHWPLHARPDDIARYATTYEVGWDAIREARYERMRAMGIIDADEAVLSPRIQPERRWDDNPTRAFDAAAMAVHAAMVDGMDRGIGRIVGKLEERGMLEHTLILFLSDNGASPEVPREGGFDRPTQTRDGREVLYTDALRKRGILPGAETTFAGIGPMWANAANTPFRFWKAESHEGGIATPLIAHWPRGMKAPRGSITKAPGHVVDIFATCLEAAGATAPREREGRAVPETVGRSLLPILAGETPAPRTLYWEHFGARAVRRGDWKLVARRQGPWELYDLSQDRTEMRDLAGEQPDRVAELAAAWQAWAESAQVSPSPDAPRAAPRQTEKARR